MVRFARSITCDGEYPARRSRLACWRSWLPLRSAYAAPAPTTAAGNATGTAATATAATPSFAVLRSGACLNESSAAVVFERAVSIAFRGMNSARMDASARSLRKPRTGFPSAPVGRSRFPRLAYAFAARCRFAISRWYSGVPGTRDRAAAWSRAARRSGTPLDRREPLPPAAAAAAPAAICSGVNSGRPESRRCRLISSGSSGRLDPSRRNGSPLGRLAPLRPTAAAAAAVATPAATSPSAVGAASSPGTLPSPSAHPSGSSPRPPARSPERSPTGIAAVSSPSPSSPRPPVRPGAEAPAAPAPTVSSS